MKFNIPKIILYTMLATIVFSLGRTFGYVQCRDKYKKDYEFQSLQIESLHVEIKKLKKTYDSIKNSPCYKKIKSSDEQL
ncbi:hypothetical protein [Elizabethkingia miricola]|uniref:Uncharacterized protein n=1 Tax=Elizabethkingia miricola TaxID=172045 RepID=A0ABD5B4N2_ELIMR|nr:hypothetical protein [Elizabethkingia miricola]MDQ8748383.1 hypothetical protein [Elizabethkingia miricola]